ncbi:MAG: hypothetical protein R3A80_08060 [Bdellovibrionota bacterium]
MRILFVCFLFTTLIALADKIPDQAHATSAAKIKASPSFYDVIKKQHCEPSENSPVDQFRTIYTIESDWKERVIAFEEPLPPSLKGVLEQRLNDVNKFKTEDLVSAATTPFEMTKEQLKKGKFDPIETAKESADWIRLSKDWKARALKIENKEISIRDLENWSEFYLNPKQRAQVGYEVKKIPSGFVEIWMLWPDKNGELKRIHTQPVATIEENAIHPEYFQELDKGNLIRFPAFGKKRELTPAPTTNTNIKKLGEGHFIFTNITDEKEIYQLRDVIENMDLGCSVRVLEEYYSKNP